MDTANIQKFHHEQFGDIRTVEIDGEIWFVGKDVANALGYTNSRKAIGDHVQKNDLGVTFCYTSSGLRKLATMNESGLYSLILSSKLPSARSFKHWVTSEVLPSLRKHGAYMTYDTVKHIMSDPDNWISLLTTLKNEHEEKLAAQKKLQEAVPKIQFADAASASDDCILIRTLAQFLQSNGINIGQNRLFERLRQDGFLIRQKGDTYNTPTQKAMALGLFQVRETIVQTDKGRRFVQTPKVTGKGQQYFLEYFLKTQQWVEMIEKGVFETLGRFGEGREVPSGHGL